jgi:hypothetical protein
MYITSMDDWERGGDVKGRHLLFTSLTPLAADAEEAFI